ncbi:hypothetical protein Poli38472_013250 [Pythium oligandrum]|uniref:Uncharacterized protein n=1 Tax=Pythium oligandrum TaxID=41045 RepID=A0A8K1C2N4_PYTOL|nr:hypothetical protein Poli38472_013250 [Pythium oligandrum]|eukprot:TMW55359.1 hypothetical protein Poli38472_013250 [Pythium oligandrum]
MADASSKESSTESECYDEEEDVKDTQVKEEELHVQDVSNEPTLGSKSVVEASFPPSEFVSPFAALAQTPSLPAATTASRSENAQDATRLSKAELTTNIQALSAEHETLE